MWHEVSTAETKINYLVSVFNGIAEAKMLCRRESYPSDFDDINNDKLVAMAISTYIILDQK